MRYLLLFLFLIPTIGFAQDRIFFRSGDMLQAIVLEVHPHKLTYKKFSNPTGPTYVVRKKDVRLIEYENGEVEVIGDQVARSLDLQPDSSYKYKHFILAYNYGDILTSKIGFTAEAVFGKEGHVGLQGYFAGGFSNTMYTPHNTKWESGLALNLYPGGQSKVMYTLSPMVRFGEGTYAEPRVHWIDQNNSYFTFEPTIKKFYGVYLGHGLRIVPVPWFDVNFVGALGMRKDLNHSGTRVHGMLQASAGIRF